MKLLLLVAAAEWRYWLRSHIVVSAVIFFILLLAVTSVTTALRMEASNHARTHQQQDAEQTFLEQPDRHPHRMVHYGHYVFRTPAPLSIFDPGLDAVTGQSIFLEGHRENSAMFAESGASANFGSLSWLTPALVYQLFAPLLLILLAHSSVTREREAKVLAPILAQGVSGQTLIFGKALAVLSFAILLLLPVILSSAIALFNGEAILAAVAVFGAYAMYLSVWIGLSVFVSSIMVKQTNALTTLLCFWLVLSLVLPSFLVNLVSQQSPLLGKIESDLAMLSDIRKLGDGHNSNDPAFAKLKADALEKYGVERIEDLPVNFRGMVAAQGEEKLTEVLNKYAAKRMAVEMEQAKSLQNYSWLSPVMLIADASRKISGTDLAHYHRFLNEAEKTRYDFVQGLNKAHIESLSYQDDINRNKDKASWARARVDASNWQVLDTFNFETESASVRISNASNSVFILLVWFIGIFISLIFVGRSLKP